MSNGDMKLYPNERDAIRIIASMQDRGRYEFTLDEFADRFYKKKPRNPSWRNNTSQLLRRIGAKLLVTKCRLERTSDIGRGAIAKYKASGYFTALLSKEKGEEA